MPQYMGFSPFEVGATTTSSCWDLGTMCNWLVIKNTDASIRVWIRIGQQPVTASTSASTDPRSFPLAAGESITFAHGIQARYVAVIAESGTPVIKGLGLNVSTPVHSLRKL